MPEQAGAGTPDGEVRTRRPRARLAALAALLLVAGGLTTGAVALRDHGHKPPGPPVSAADVHTATVARTDLSDSRSLPGTLGFGPQTPVTGRGTGVVTALATAGATVTRGHSLYRADDQPVVLFYGGTPLFRTLKAPAGKQTPQRGGDVTVVADNLQALGYAIGYRPPDTDGHGATYTAELAAAVKRWQQHIGMTATGTLGVGQTVVLPGPVRIGQVQARLGDPVQETLMSVTATGRRVTVPVEAGDDTGIKAGAMVTITLPYERSVPGTVTAVSHTVQAGGNDAGSGQQDPNSPPTVDVTVAPVHASDLAGLDAAPVTVRFTTTTRHGVLAVPVTALVALKEGGYALQRTDGTLVAVTTGLFAAGQVEVSGPGVTAGLRVETAS
ncbi:peptidoglycan-binding protein [Streptomyces sp. PLK6-54]|uniref:Peptidoglycan-binding protein n=1 Tax=Actinacidiphila acidipaludis TaxID=2873382 RepID=A0ABS7QH03_9ACTN|nr:peptidoglycan-binding protein [Streptomyces acidipaludis]